MNRDENKLSSFNDSFNKNNLSVSVVITGQPINRKLLFKKNADHYTFMILKSLFKQV